MPSDIAAWNEVLAKGGAGLTILVLGYVIRAFMRVDVVPRLLYEREREERMKSDTRADKAIEVAHNATSALNKMADVQTRSHERP